MEITLFEIFTFFGSILGIVAFFISCITPISEHNKLKWAELSNIITPADIDNYANQLNNGILYTYMDDKMTNLIQSISQKKECIYFKGNAGKKALKKLYEIKTNYNLISEKIGTPCWTPLGKHIAWKIDKDYFFQIYTDSSEAEKKMILQRRFITEKADEIMKLYKEVRACLTQSPYEYLKFWQ